MSHSEELSEPSYALDEVYFVQQSFLGRVFKWVIATLATLSIYRFWAMTHMRRDLWSSTHVGGDTLRFHGTAKELFIGFLIVVAVLVPLYILSYLAQLMGPVTAIINAVVFPIVFVTLYAYALFRRRRYLLTRTSWRGIRLSLHGSPWKYVRTWLF